MIVNRFLVNASLNDTDYTYWVMRSNKNWSCKDMLDFWLDHCKLEGGEYSRTEMLNQLMEIFTELVQLTLYVNSGQPDLREFAEFVRKPFKSKKSMGRTPKEKDGSIYKYIIVGFNYKKEYTVGDYFKMQHYGPKNSLRRYQLVKGSNRTRVR